MCLSGVPWWVITCMVPSRLTRWFGEVDVVDEEAGAGDHVEVLGRAGDHVVDARREARRRAGLDDPHAAHVRHELARLLVDRARVAGVAAEPVGGEDGELRVDRLAQPRPVVALEAAPRARRRRRAAPVRALRQRRRAPARSSSRNARWSSRSTSVAAQARRAGRPAAGSSPRPVAPVALRHPPEELAPVAARTRAAGARAGAAASPTPRLGARGPGARRRTRRRTRRTRRTASRRRAVRPDVHVAPHAVPAAIRSAASSAGHVTGSSPCAPAAKRTPSARRCVAAAAACSTPVAPPRRGPASVPGGSGPSVGPAARVDRACGGRTARRAPPPPAARRRARGRPAAARPGARRTRRSRPRRGRAHSLQRLCRRVVERQQLDLGRDVRLRRAAGHGHDGQPWHAGAPL